MAQPMGLGDIGGPQVVFKRQFRWTFRVRNICGEGQGLTENFVKLAARPSLDIEETEIDYLHGKTWIPGKGAWQNITVTYYDVNTNQLQPLFRWLSSVYEFGTAQAPVTLRMASKREDYSAEGVLTLFDGCGTAMEKWSLRHLWPQSVNFGELDYASSDICTVELTMRYTNVKYENFCPGFSFEPCCDPC